MTSALKTTAALTVLTALYLASLLPAAAFVTLGVAYWGLTGFPVACVFLAVAWHLAVRHARRAKWAGLRMGGAA